MSRRKIWQKILDAEVQRWLAMSYEELISRLSDPPHVYEVEHDSQKYQVEVDILEKSENYVDVAVSVDDGSLPASIVPATHNFVCRKPQ